MQPSLREQMLMKGQVDGVFGYVNTIRFSAKLIGVDPDKDIRFINYGDYGMDLYSNGIIVSKKLVQRQSRGGEGARRRDQSRHSRTRSRTRTPPVAAVAKREPLIKVAVERERLDATLKDEMNHPGDRQDRARQYRPGRDSKRAIDILVDAENLPRTPTVDEIFTPAFLPPIDRIAQEAVLNH